MAPPGHGGSDGTAACELTVLQLRQKLKDRGLSQAGSKKELVARYEAAVDGTGARVVQPMVASSEMDSTASGAVGVKRRRDSEPSMPSNVVNGKRTKVEGTVNDAEMQPAGTEDATGASALTVKYAGKDQTKSRNICIRGLPASLPDVDAALGSLLESLGLHVSRLKAVPNPRAEGSGLAMVQLASEDEAAFAIIALDGEDGGRLLAPLDAAASSGDPQEPPAGAAPGAGAPALEELEEFRVLYPMDERAFDYIKVSPPEVQREFLATFSPPHAQEDYSKIVTVHLRFCLRQHEGYTGRQAVGVQFGGGSTPEEQLQEFRSRFPMDERAFDYLKVAPLEVQMEVLKNFRPAADEQDFSRMVTAHIKFCMKLCRQGSLKSVPAIAGGEGSLPNDQLEEFRASFPMDSKAFDYLKISPLAVQTQVLTNFRPQSEETDYSKMVTAYINFCTKQLREGGAAPAGLGPARAPQFLGASDSAAGGISDEGLEEFRSKFPMDSRAFDYLKISPAQVQERVLSTFRPQKEEQDYSKMVTAHISFCLKKLREEGVGAPTSAADAGLAIEDLAARLEQFRATFPMDERAFDYLVMAPPSVQERVVSTFRPQGAEEDYSRMVTAHIKYCLKQHRELTGGEAASDLQSSDPLALETFRGIFPMDTRAFDFLATAPAEVQMKVLSTFRPQNEEQDYSRMVMAHVKFCLKQHRETGAAVVPADAGSAGAGQPSDAMGVSTLEHFRALFPMDSRAFDALSAAPLEVQERLISTFRPHNAEQDYSRMIMAHIKFCMKQLGDAGADVGTAAEQPPAVIEYGEDGCVSHDTLEQFCATFPMDWRAFDYLKVSSRDVQVRVISTFKPQAAETDYSRMVTAHIKYCTKQAREAASETGAVVEQPQAAMAMEWGEDGAVSQESLEQFRAAFPMDARAFDYLKVSTPDVQARVVGTFRPQAEEADYSRMVTAHIRHCTRQAREAGGEAAAAAAAAPAGQPAAQQAAWSEEGAVSQEALEEFAARFPMDSRAFDYLKVSPPEVQARVVGTFRPQAEETDYSRMVTAHIKYCMRLFREAGGDAGARVDASSAGVEQAVTAAGWSDGAVQDDAAQRFLERFPMDERAFEYLQMAPPEVQARVISTFRPQNEEQDYSRMVTAHIKYCLKQHRDGAGGIWSHADTGPAAGDTGSSSVSNKQLDQFRATYPMDDRAFDYLKVSPAEVQARVVRTFSPMRQESDYSRMVTAHIRFCIRQLRDGVGGS